MGNAGSSVAAADSCNALENEFDDIWWTNNNTNSPEMNMTKEDGTAPTTTTRIDEENTTPNKSGSTTKLQREISEKLDEFKLELGRKHEKRREMIAEKRKEMQDLRDEVIALRQENRDLKEAAAPPSSASSVLADRDVPAEIQRLREENEDLLNKLKDFENVDAITRKNRELKISIAEMQTELQNLNAEVVGFEKEREEYRKHVVALKDVIKVTKEMLAMKENQMNELKQKVDEIEVSLADNEMRALSHNIKQEYEKQLENMRNLRMLYDERQRVHKIEKDELESSLADKTKELEDELKKTSDLTARVDELETENSKNYDEIKTLESNFGLAKAESRQYQAELTVINQLFSQILLGFNNSQDIDIDQLIKHLEENHDLLQDIVVNEVSNQVSSALPKVLLDLLHDINAKKSKEVQNQTQIIGTTKAADQKLETIEEETESQTSSLHQLNSAAEIVENLPKVWRVLIELLSHQCAPVNIQTTADNVKQNEDPCYKLVETPKGPSLVLSVSQTFIRLKDLILEKKSLEKETCHLKQLNTHLETRLQDQEKRLGVVSSELSKTWHVVGKLQKQHHLLHTQEKILRYELAQKRKLLTELKEELEYSREKWKQAREKNSTTQEQWKALRSEFASRKTSASPSNDDLNNSVESGYSDERESDDEPGYETDVSEGNQQNNKPNSPENGPAAVEMMERIEEDDSGSSVILEVVQNEIADIEATTDVDEEDEEQMKTDKEDDLVQITNNSVVIVEEGAASTSLPSSTDSGSAIEEKSIKNKSLEEVWTARQERLSRLEGQCQSLVKKVTNTSQRSVAICNKLEGLHEIYGESSSSSGSRTTTLQDNKTLQTDDDNTKTEEKVDITSTTSTSSSSPIEEEENNQE